MLEDTPQEVLANLRADIKRKKIRRKYIAAILGFQTEQSVTNLLNSKRYLNQKQAEKLYEYFNYNPIYLTTGEEELQNNKRIIEQDNDEDELDKIGTTDCSKQLFNDYQYLIHTLKIFREIVKLLKDPNIEAIYNELISCRKKIQKITNYDSAYIKEEHLKCTLTTINELHKQYLYRRFLDLKLQYKLKYKIKINGFQSTNLTNSEFYEQIQELKDLYPDLKL